MEPTPAPAIYASETKLSHQAPIGKLHYLLISKNRWSVVSVDFITELPDIHCYNAIIVVVDSVEKRVHFIPTTITCSAEDSKVLFQLLVDMLHLTI